MELKPLGWLQGVCCLPALKKPEVCSPENLQASPLHLGQQWRCALALPGSFWHGRGPVAGFKLSAAAAGAGNSL